MIFTISEDKPKLAIPFTDKGFGVITCITAELTPRDVQAMMDMARQEPLVFQETMLSLLNKFRSVRDFHKASLIPENR